MGSKESSSTDQSVGGAAGDVLCPSGGSIPVSNQYLTSGQEADSYLVLKIFFIFEGNQDDCGAFETAGDFTLLQ